MHGTRLVPIANNNPQLRASSSHPTAHPPLLTPHCSHPAAVYAAPEEQIKAARAWTRWENTTSNLYGPKGEAREKKLRPACTQRERERANQAELLGVPLEFALGIDCHASIPL